MNREQQKRMNLEKDKKVIEDAVKQSSKKY